MKCLGKVICTAHIKNKDWKKALNSFLMAYRATPHPSTGVTPADLLYPGRRFKTLLPCHASNNVDKASVRDFNNRAMAQSKAYQDRKRNARLCTLALGDTVLVRQQKRNKITPYYDPAPYTVIAVKGSMVTAERKGCQIVRNSSFFKQIPRAKQLPGPACTSSRAFVPDTIRKSSQTFVPATSVFFFPPSLGGVPQRARVPPIPAMPNEPVAPEAEDIAPAVAGPPIAAFHPQPDAALAHEPFALPQDFRPNPYNLRNRNHDN